MVRTLAFFIHYKNEQDTQESLNSLLLNSRKPNFFDLAIVANSPLKKNYPGVKILGSGENNGFAKGVNLGLQYATKTGYDYSLILNNDIKFPPLLIETLTNYAHQNPSIGLISPKIYFYPGYEYHTNKYTEDEKGKVIWYAGGKIDWQNIYTTHIGLDEVDKGQFDKIEKTEFATGCCMLINMSAVSKTGYFDEKYFLYFEDVDYSVRTAKLGYKITYFGKTHIWHKNAASSGKPGSSLHVYYQSRNRLYFGFRFSSVRTKKSLIIDALKKSFTDGRQFKALRDFMMNKMGKGSV